MLPRAIGSAICVAMLAAAPVAVTPAHAQAGRPCTPAARLRGDRALIVPLRTLLARRGVLPEPAPGCPALAVDVRTRRPGLALVISDADGRITRRRIARPQTAAMVIESWARTDLDASLPRVPRSPRPSDRPQELVQLTSSSVLPALPVMPDLSPTSTPAEAIRAVLTVHGTATSAAPLPAAPIPGASRIQLSTALESAVGAASAGSRGVWLGGGLSLCVRWGPTCGGLAARMSQSAEGRRPELLATLELPVALGALTISPRIGFGIARLYQSGSTVADDGPLPVDPPGGRNGSRAPSGDGDGNRRRDGLRGDRSDGDRRRDPDGRPGDGGGGPVGNGGTSGGAEPAAPGADAGNGEPWVGEALCAHAGVAFFYPLGSRMGIEVAVSYGATAMAFDPTSRAWSGGELGLRLGLRYGKP